MSDYEAFVHELIEYIFKVQDKDDDNLSAEIICRKLYKYGLIENVNHKWRMKYRPKHRWPATVHNCRADKEYWRCITIKPTDTEIAKAIVHKMIDDAVIAEDSYPDLRQKMHDAVDEYEPQTERSE